MARERRNGASSRLNLNEKMKQALKKTLAWHFLPADCKLTNGDGRLVEVGKTIRVKCAPVLCEQGLHASIDILDALSFHRGPVLCRVELIGGIQHQSDKIVGKARKCLAMANIERVLRVWAIDCAEHVIPIFEKRYPGNDSVRKCINAARLYVAGKITQQQLIEARRAAYAAYAAAAYAAAVYAAYAADAAYAAYAADARKEERDWQRARLMELIPAELKAW